MVFFPNFNMDCLADSLLFLSLCSLPSLSLGATQLRLCERKGRADFRLYTPSILSINMVRLVYHDLYYLLYYFCTVSNHGYLVDHFTNHLGVHGFQHVLVGSKNHCAKDCPGFQPCGLQ